MIETPRKERKTKQKTPKACWKKKLFNRPKIRGFFYRGEKKKKKLLHRKRQGVTRCEAGDGDTRGHGHGATRAVVCQPHRLRGARPWGGEGAARTWVALGDNALCRGCDIPGILWDDFPGDAPAALGTGWRTRTPAPATVGSPPPSALSRLRGDWVIPCHRSRHGQATAGTQWVQLDA